MYTLFYQIELSMF